MSITSNARRIFRVVRPTTYVLERTEAAAVHAVAAKCPSVAGYVQIRLWGDDLTGSIEVDGLVAGSPTTEVIQATGPIAVGEALLTGCKLFECVTEIRTSGLADELPAPEILARLVGEGGNPLETLCELSDCLIAHGQVGGAGRGRWPMTPAGKTEDQPSLIMHDDIWGFEPRRGDLYVEQRQPPEGGALRDWRTWEVTGDPEFLGALRSAHWELGIRMANNRRVTETPAP